MMQKLCLFGVGLIGGSFAKVCRERGLAKEIVACGRPDDEANLRQALALGVIDAYALDVQSAVEGADWVMLAAPVGAFPAILAQLRPFWNDHAIYTDVGSTKADVAAALRQVFGEIPANFVPGHPIAGAEASGVAAARSDLFEGKKLVLTPLPETDAEPLAKVERLWRQIGAQVCRMTIEHHDKVLAATSHLPHLLAFTLVDLLDSQPDRAEIYQLAASGFKDFTRIAGSDPAMWRDICLANRAQILPLLTALQQHLAVVGDFLEQADGEALTALFARARSAQNQFLDIFHSRSTT